MLASACFSLELEHSQVSVLTPRTIIISTIIYDVPNLRWLSVASAKLPMVLAEKPLPTNSWAVEQVKLCLHQTHIVSAVRSHRQLALRAVLLLSYCLGVSAAPLRISCSFISMLRVRIIWATFSIRLYLRTHRSRAIPSSRILSTEFFCFAVFYRRVFFL